jgi:hypothetical protein
MPPYLTRRLFAVLWLRLWSWYVLRFQAAFEKESLIGLDVGMFAGEVLRGVDEFGHLDAMDLHSL